jgi:glycosyltransferase involved in cell wall biosynthesis
MTQTTAQKTSAPPRSYYDPAKTKAKILWISWKDRWHPQAGGAEVLTHELRQRLVADGHSVALLTSGYRDAPERETKLGVEIIRRGANRYTHPFKAAAHFLARLRGGFDIVVEEVNATPYFSVLAERSAKRFLFYHHLEREVWLHEAPPPLNILGYHVFEPLATRLLARSGTPLITVSESTKQDLASYGFDAERTHIISEGIELKPMGKLNDAQKFSRPTMLSLGGIRPMKRTLDQVKAFELAKSLVPDLQFKIAGNASGSYGQKVLRYIANSRYAADIDYLGRIAQRDKPRLMRSCHFISVTSVKEGWGLIVTEAASQGTPAVVYDVPGLRDSVRHEQTGLITRTEPMAMAKAIAELLKNKTAYNRLRRKAWEWSKRITFDQSYQDLKRVLEIA